jgi:sugar lactone lactonase YvrE
MLIRFTAFGYRSIIASLAPFAGVLLSAPARAQGDVVQPMLGGVNSENMALEVNLATGQALRLSGVGLEGYRHVQGLTSDPSTGTLYGVDTEAHELVTIDPETRQGTPVGGIGFLGVSSIAFDPVDDVIYGVDVVNGAPDRLVEIDPSSGMGVLVGSTGVADVGGLAYDPSSHTLYGTDIGTADNLLRINTTTGQATVVGPLGFVWVASLTRDPATGTLYGVDLQSDRLITINRSNGHGTAAPLGLGADGFNDVRGLAIDSAGVLYGMDANTAQLIEIERPSGAGTLLGPLGFRDVTALAYAASVGALYATDTRNDKLLRLNPFSGHATVLGDLVDPSGARLYEVYGLTWDPFALRLYGVDRLSRRLLVINRANGRALSAVTLTYPGGAPIYGLRTLAFDTHARVLYGVASDSIESRLVRVDPATGVCTLVEPADTLPFPNVFGLVYVAHARMLAATADDSDPQVSVDQLVAIQPGNGAWFEVAPLSMGRVYGLVYDPSSGSVGGTTGSFLYLIAFNGQGTAIGTLGASDVEGLAFDPTVGLYGTTLGNSTDPIGRLLSIDSGTGWSSPVGPLVDASDNGYTSVAGLTFNRSTHALYGSDTARDQLVRIDRLTARVTVVGALGFQDVEGLACHANGTLYGVDGVSDSLIRIDPANGHGTLVGPLGFPDVEGLEFDAATGILYGTDVERLRLIRIDIQTGQGTVVGSTAYKVDGLAGRLP